MTSAYHHADLALLDYVEARRLLADIATFCVLRPVYPSLGCGKLRVLRIRPSSTQGLEVIAGYESYERIDD